MNVLDEFIGTSNGAASNGAQRKRVVAQAVESDADTRTVQVKAAVRASEKLAFERLAKKREQSLSDLIRDFLLGEAKRERFL